MNGAVLVLAATLAGLQTPVDKANADERAVAEVEALQSGGRASRPARTGKSARRPVHVDPCIGRGPGIAVDVHRQRRQRSGTRASTCRLADNFNRAVAVRAPGHCNVARAYTMTRR